MDQAVFHLVSHVLCPYVQRSIIVLQEKAIPYTRTDIDLYNTPEWFKRISPMGKVPVLQINESRALFESAVICEYLNDITPGSLHPIDFLEKAYHRAWMEFGSGILDSIGALYTAENKASFDNRCIKIQAKFQQVENEINSAPYFSGDRFQLIDAVYGPIFRYFDVFDRFTDLAIFQNLPKVSAWRQALQQRVSVQCAVVPEYPQLLLQFLRERNGYMSGFLSSDVA